MTAEHDSSRAFCPFLPVPERVLGAEHTRSLGKDRSGRFYLAALEYGHSLWLQGFPARGILLLNRAMGCALEEEGALLEKWPIPYEAMLWILRNHRVGEDFIGNPRRHWQHLATRMAPGPRAELRTWRAWACWYLACRELPEMPADEVQIREEGVVEPTLGEIEGGIRRLGVEGPWEVDLLALGEAFL
jgi:hypothetical protein